ncbi:Mediator of RNA polymerase II transcription subunit 11 [Ananas comosus]|uniref:Mediator of RNA polymerase II transcription subunit 11 n=1 Tax=Ananas comosus TaxID=4615 RepID=A0A199VVQ6_ANACO|nr:Mediator of RNA polymerase II transcription subunit 11 [Ananas comosus]
MGPPNQTTSLQRLHHVEKEIQTTLREEIKSACEYRPFEKCDYSARISNEICCKKLEYIIEQLDCMQQNLEQSSNGS